MRKANTLRIMTEYHKKMGELGTREARDRWCLQVEQDLGCSTEEKGDGIPPGLLRVRKLENDLLNVVGVPFFFFFTTDTLTSQILPVVFSKIYVFAGIIPANPCDPVARAASGLIFNDPLVSDVLNAEGNDFRLLFNNLELGIR